MSEEGEIEYKYLDMDNEVLYDNKPDYLEALKNRRGKAIERCIHNYQYGQVLFAAGVKHNDFGEPFSEREATALCRKLSEPQPLIPSDDRHVVMFRSDKGCPRGE